MTKKEIAEIKKTLKLSRATIWRIAGCYVDTDHSLSPIPPQDFTRLPEEEAEQYLGIFKKTLSGSVGKTLHTVDFPTEAEQEGTGHSLLMALKESKLKDGDALEALCQKVADSYQSEDAFCIIAAYAEYDVPVKSNDAMGDMGGSDTVFPHLFLAVCPAVMSKAALSYQKKKNCIVDAAKDILLSPPAFGLLFPAFHDRAADIHSMLLFTKKQTEAEDYVVNSVFGCVPPVSMEQVQEGFASLVAGSLGENCTFESAACVQAGLQGLEEVGKEELYSILSAGGDAKKDVYDELYKEVFRDQPLPASQVAPKKTIVKTGNITVTCPADILELVEVKEVDGKKCIVISPDGNVEVNGMPVV